MTLDFNENTPSGLEREFPKSLIGWYEFHKGAKALFVSGGLPEGEVLREVLAEAGLSVTVTDPEAVETGNEAGREQYDYIVGFGILEKASDPASFLSNLRDMLTQDGVLLLGCENRLGMRYFCGDRDVFTNRCFDGIEGYFDPYADLNEHSGRTYSRSELEGFLKNAGLANHRFYSIMPVLENPRMLFAEDYLPEEKLDVRMTPQYRSPETVFMEEERMYQTLIDNGLFHKLANGYLVEAVYAGSLANVKAVTSSLDRGRELATYTVIRRDNLVEKRAAYPEGSARIRELSEHDRYLKAHGISTVEGRTDEQGRYVMPYMDAPTATEYFRDLLKRDRPLFYKELDRFMELVEGSSELVPYEEVDWDRFDPQWKSRKADDPNRDKWHKKAEAQDPDLGSVMEKGFIDLVCLNCFVVDGKFVFFDQEFAFDRLPANVIKVRTIDLICTPETDRILRREELLERYRLLKYLDLWRSYENVFITNLRNRKTLASYYMNCNRNGQTTVVNKTRISYPEDQYDRIFRDIFNNIEDKEIYVFGSGAFAKSFLSRYGDRLKIGGVIDNDPVKHGQKIGTPGYEICSPEILKSKEKGTFRVMICIKRYQPVLVQLDRMGISAYAVYNPDMIYDPGNLRAGSPGDKPENSTVEPEAPRYGIGYVAGVFDLFHMGHVNLLRRAKEQCAHLIVGVVTDEQVINSKKTTPHIPFNQRIEIVRACRYVDEAVRIPPEYADSREAFMRYHFDVQFSGSDYENDGYWLSVREWLRKQGSDLVFFPYTEGVSSTMIKEGLSAK